MDSAFIKQLTTDLNNRDHSHIQTLIDALPAGVIDSYLNRNSDTEQPDLDMDFASMVEQSRQTYKEAAAHDKEVADLAFAREVKQLTPLAEKMKGALSPILDVIIHTDKTHLPCPAIHVKGPNSEAIQNSFGEIFYNDEGKLRSGSCLNHEHMHEDERAFLIFAIKEIGQKL